MLFFYAEGTEHCRTKGRTFPPTMGRARLSQPEGRADYGAGALVAARGARRPWAGAVVAARETRRPWGGRAYCVPRDAPTMGRAGLLQPEGRADHGRAGLSQPEGRADHGAGGLVAARETRRPWGGGSHRTRRTFPLTVCGRACCSSAAAELAETFFRSCPWAGRTRQVMRSAAARAEQENTARSKAYRAFARRWHGKTDVANF